MNWDDGLALVGNKVLHLTGKEGRLLGQRDMPEGRTWLVAWHNAPGVSYELENRLTLLPPDPETTEYTYRAGCFWPPPPGGGLSLAEFEKVLRVGDTVTIKFGSTRQSAEPTVGGVVETHVWEGRVMEVENDWYLALTSGSSACPHEFLVVAGLDRLVRVTVEVIDEGRPDEPIE